MQAKELAARLAGRAEEVARYLLPNGKRVANEYKIGSVSGEEGQSLSVCIAGEKAGIFSDFATGQSGDLLELWRLVRGRDLSEIIKEVKAYLGIATSSFLSQRPSNFVKPTLKNVTSLDSDNNNPVCDYLVNIRKLSLTTLKAFEIGAHGREIVFPFKRDGELLQVKYLSIDRPNGKKQIRVEKDCQSCLFGWQVLSLTVRTITLTEGELDAMSLYQYGFPALSLPFGGGVGSKQKWLEYEFDYLERFDQIYLCLDNNEVGQQTLPHLIERLGRHRCLVVKLPYKDANECLQKGVTQEEIQRCFNEAQSLDPSELKPAHAFVGRVIDTFYPPANQPLGYYTPWEKTKNKIIFRPAELSLWTGINGHGKSQFLGHLVLSMMEQGAKVCIASLELKPERLLMRLTRQVSGLAEPTKGYIEAIHDWYRDKLWLFDLVGTAKANRLLEVFLYARQRYGIDVFVIDSFMKCGIAEEDYQQQKAFVENLCDFKNEHNCHIHLIVHPRKASDESRPPNKLDMKGSGAVSDLADNCFTIWRNKHKEDEIRKLRSDHAPIPDNLAQTIDCLWICDKQRNGEWEGKIGLWYDHKSFQYLNHHQQKPKRYVDYSSLKLANQ